VFLGGHLRGFGPWVERLLVAAFCFVALKTASFLTEKRVAEKGSSYRKSVRSTLMRHRSRPCHCF